MFFLSYRWYFLANVRFFCSYCCLFLACHIISSTTLRWARKVCSWSTAHWAWWLALYIATRCSWDRLRHHWHLLWLLHILCNRSTTATTRTKSWSTWLGTDTEATWWHFRRNRRKRRTTIVCTGWSTNQWAWSRAETWHWEWIDSSWRPRAGITSQKTWHRLSVSHSMRWSTYSWWWAYGEKNCVLVCISDTYFKIMQIYQGTKVSHHYLKSPKMFVSCFCPQRCILEKACRWEALVCEWYLLQILPSCDLFVVNWLHKDVKFNLYTISTYLTMAIMVFDIWYIS